jgi:HAD superfamily hydrolase (TIGR01549 family)
MFSMLNNHNIAFIDFDKTIYDLEIPDFEQRRKELVKDVKEKFDVDVKFYPILEDTEKVSVSNNAIRKYVYDFIDEIENKATGYFYKYAESVLKKVSEKMPVVIVSNNNSVLISKKLAEYNLSKYVKYVYGRDTYDYYKPTGKVLEYCCSQLSMPFSEADKFIFIGDGWRDYDCAWDFAKKNGLSYTFIHAKLLDQNETI